MKKLTSVFLSAKTAVKEDPSWAFFLAFAFLAGVSMPLARIAMVLSLAFSLAKTSRRRMFRFTASMAGWCIYLGLALVVTLVCVYTLNDPELDPAGGLKRLPKLLWYAGMLIPVMQVDSRARLLSTLKALVLGCALSALFVIFVHPVMAWIQLVFPTDVELAAGSASPAGMWWYNLFDALGSADAVTKWIYSPFKASNAEEAIIKLGTMQAAQRFMVAFPAALCLFFEAKRIQDPAARRSAVRFMGWMMVIIALGLFGTYKRGPIMACAFVSLGLALFRLTPKQAVLTVVALAVVVGGLFASVPALRLRFSQLPDEFNVRRGGRTMMWTRIVPTVHAEHPWGIGFRSLTYEKMKRITNNGVEWNQKHVHSVPLQSFVDFGYPGVAAYLAWMILAFSATGRLARCARRSPGAGDSLPETMAFAAPLAMLAALFLYGLVEYNLADSEVVLLYALAMGLSTPTLDRVAQV